MDNTRLLKHALNYKPRGRRDRGRPRKRWQRVDVGTGQEEEGREEEDDDDDDEEQEEDDDDEEEEEDDDDDQLKRMKREKFEI
jgi:hypothetical protein